MDGKLKITLDELNGIIKGLVLENFAHVEPNALTEIKAMIKTLPHPEVVEKLADNPRNIEKIQEDIGKIMRLIGVYGKRDMEYKTRYKARTQLEPRYKVLKWEMPEAKVAARNDLIRDLIKLSARVDEDGLDAISQRIMDCANAIYRNEMPLEDLYLSTKEVIQASILDGNIRREAQALTDINFDFGDIRNGINQVAAWFNNIKEAIGLKTSYLEGNPKTRQYTKYLDNIWNKITKLNIASPNSDYKEVDNNLVSIQDQMAESLVPTSVLYKGKPVNVEWEKMPPRKGEPYKGYERAVIWDGNKKYEVQQYDNGEYYFKDITPRPKKPTVTTPTATPTVEPITPEATVPQADPIAQSRELPKEQLEKFKSNTATVEDLRVIYDYLEKKKTTEHIDSSKVLESVSFNLSNRMSRTANTPEIASIIDAIIKGESVNRNQLDQLQALVKQEISKREAEVVSEIPEVSEEPTIGEPISNESVVPENVEVRPEEKVVEDPEEPEAKPEANNIEPRISNSPIPLEPQLPKMPSYEDYYDEDKKMMVSKYEKIRNRLKGVPNGAERFIKEVEAEANYFKNFVDNELYYKMINDIKNKANSEISRKNGLIKSLKEINKLKDDNPKIKGLENEINKLKKKMNLDLVKADQDHEIAPKEIEVYNDIMKWLNEYKSAYKEQLEWKDKYGNELSKKAFNLSKYKKIS